MSDQSQGPGWWLASDGKWYPPESVPVAPAPPPPPQQPAVPQYHAPVAPAGKVCSKCGMAVPARAKVCGHCGTTFVGGCGRTLYFVVLACLIIGMLLVVVALLA